MPVPLEAVNAARGSLVQLATTDALVHLHAALGSLQSLADRLRNEPERPPASEQRCLERELLKFRAELRQAAALTDQGLAFCKDWADYLQPPPSYQPDGNYAAAGFAPSGDLSVQA